MNVKKLLTSILKAIKVDYVVEQGKEGNWTYCKWNSGKAELWCRFGTTITCTTSAYNGWYRNANAYNIAYPFALTEVMHIATPTIETQGLAGIFTTINTVGLSNANYWVYCPSSVSSRSITVNHKIVGRWK